MYTRTGAAEAMLKDLLCLSTDAVCSYQLGSHELRVTNAAGDDVQGAGEVNDERTTRLEEQMLKARGECWDATLL